MALPTKAFELDLSQDPLLACALPCTVKKCWLPFTNMSLHEHPPPLSHKPCQPAQRTTSCPVLINRPSNSSPISHALLFLFEQRLGLIQLRLYLFHTVICILGCTVQLLLQEAEPHICFTELLTLERQERNQSAPGPWEWWALGKVPCSTWWEPAQKSQRLSALHLCLAHAPITNTCHPRTSWGKGQDSLWQGVTSQTAPP